jgi:hypothetical protein
MFKYLTITLVFVLCTAGALNTYAQISDTTATVFDPINENLFVNTKWRYTYTTHAQSNTIIHKADEMYRYFVYFRYDYGFQTHLNGRLSDGIWKLNKEQNELLYPYRKITWWRIVSFTEEALILEFTQHQKSSYRYHFVRVDNADAPFVRSPNDLPDIHVNYAEMAENTAETNYLRFLNNRGVRYKKDKWALRKERRTQRASRRVARLQKTKKGRSKLADEAPKELLQIELVGGGFYGGVDPVYRNMILIKSDGKVVREYQSELLGLVVDKHFISRENLEKLVAFIEDKKFFEFDQIYPCNNQDCLERLSDKPRPIALRIAVTKGVRRKLISLPIWDGNGRRNSLLDYPEALDRIVHAIETTANPPSRIQ